MKEQGGDREVGVGGCVRVCGGGGGHKMEAHECVNVDIAEIETLVVAQCVWWS